MSATAAIGLLLFLVGGFLGVLFLVARTTPEVPTPGHIDPGIEPDPSSRRAGDSVLLAMAVIGLFAALIGLLLLVDATG